MKKASEKKKDLRWFFVLLLFLGVLILLFSPNDEEPGGSTQSKYQFQDPAHINRVNQHLKETAINLEAERQQRLLEVNREIQKYRNSNQQDIYQTDQSLTFETDQNMMALTRELDGSREIQDYELTPEQAIQKKLYEEELAQRAHEAYREQYAQQFVENARRAGWDVKLGPNYEVLSVKPIKQRNRQPTHLFDGGFSGSR